MSGPIERELRQELEQLRRRNGQSDAHGYTDIEVTWRDAAPDERPEGMARNPPTDDDSAKLTYDVWEAQRECLDAVESGGHDIVAFLAGYGSGKSVFGARWLLAQALENPGSRFLSMGVDFQKARDTTYPKLFAQLPGERTTLTTRGASKRFTGGYSVPRPFRANHSLRREDGSGTVAEGLFYTLANGG